MEFNTVKHFISAHSDCSHVYDFSAIFAARKAPLLQKVERAYGIRNKLMSYTIYLEKFRAIIQSPVVKNIVWLSFDKASRLIIGMVVGIWVARYLGPAQWGEINYIVAIISIVTAIANLGMDGFLVKEITAAPHQKEQILGTAFVSRMAFIPIGLAVVALYFYLSNAPRQYYILFALLSPSFLIAPFDVIDLEFQSRLQSKLTVISKNIGYFIGAAIKVYFLLTEKSLLWFAAAIGCETVFAYILLIYNYQRRQNLFAWSFSREKVRELLVAGWPFMVSNLAVILYMRVDQLMIGRLAGEAQLGLFSSATRVTDIFLFIPVAISGSYLSTLVRIKQQQGDEAFVGKIRNFIEWMTKISIAIAIFVSVFSKQIIDVLYGPKFSGAEGVLVAHIWALVPVFIGVAAGQYLVIENLQRYNIYKTGIGLGINLLLNVILIPEMGAIGAAVATLISFYISAIFTNALFSATRQLFGYQIDGFKRLFSFNNK